MVRSGWVSRRRPAGSPTITLPSGSRLTTEGQRVDPDGPGIHFGAPVCGSMCATRLFVVPRSIPTVLAICLNLAGADEKPQVHKPDAELQVPHLKPYAIPVPFERWSPNFLCMSGDSAAHSAAP